MKGENGTKYLFSSRVVEIYFYYNSRNNFNIPALTSSTFLDLHVAVNSVKEVILGRPLLVLKRFYVVKRQQFLFFIQPI